MPKLGKNAPKKEKAARVKDEMHKFKNDELHSGSKTGPKVSNRKQAIAIALSEAGESKRSKKSTKKAEKKPKHGKK